MLDLSSKARQRLLGHNFTNPTAGPQFGVGRREGFGYNPRLALVAWPHRRGSARVIHHEYDH